MKRRIVVAVLAVSAAALIPAGTASATTLTSPTGTSTTPKLEVESDGHIAFDLVTGLGKIECSSTLVETIESDGEGKAAVGPISLLTFPTCTNNWHLTTVTGGSLEIQWTSGYNGTVTWTGATIQGTRLGLTCSFVTNETTLGTITGGSPATIDFEGSFPIHNSSPLCGTAPVKVTGSYKVAGPNPLYVDEALSPPPTVLTSPTGTSVTPTLKVESEGHVALDHPIAKIQCQWAIEGTTESHNTKEGATISLSSLATTGCTESWHGTTSSAGKLIVLRSSGYNGKVTWSGGTVEMTRLGTTCRYKSENTTLGTLTGGSPATIHVEANLPFHSGSALCGEEAYPLTGSFEVTSPSALYVDG